MVVKNTIMYDTPREGSRENLMKFRLQRYTSIIYRSTWQVSHLAHEIVRRGKRTMLMFFKLFRVQQY